MKKFIIFFSMKHIYIHSKNNKSKVYTLDNNAEPTFIKLYPLLSNNEIVTHFPHSICYHCVAHNHFSFWEQINTSHNPFDWISCIHEGQTVLYQLNEIVEKIILFLQLPQIENRNFQEGITLLIENQQHIFGFLILKNNIYGIFEHNLLNISTTLLQKDIEEFRFGWLPNEEILKQNGYGCILKNIPAEAEGFRPIYIVCSQQHQDIFNQIGKFIQLPPLNTLINILQ